MNVMNERKTPPSLRATKTGCCSGPDRDRTDRLFHAMEALYQMSYRPKYQICSNQTQFIGNYKPNFKVEQCSESDHFCPRLGDRRVNGAMQKIQFKPIPSRIKSR